LVKNAPFPVAVESLEAGEVGFLICGIKDIRDVKVGDTMTSAKNPATEQLPGFQKIKPMVFAGIFPIEATDYENLKVKPLINWP
jgi:GTP-binding protein LepA